MATLTIRNLPAELHESLKLRAKRNHRSLNQEVIAELSRAGRAETFAEKNDRVEQEVLRIDALRSRAKGFLTAQEIDEAKWEGRA